MISSARSSQAEFAAALLDAGRACPAGLRTWNGSNPAARLAVYRNNVVGSLIDALADTIPVVAQLVGDEFFRAMAALFVREAPPRSRILAHYGTEFPAFIERFEPARAVPYLADVARLELACVRAFHAADAEPLADAAVQRALASAERIGELRLTCHPSVAVLRSPYAMVSLWAAHQADGDPAGVDPDRAEAALVLRQDLDVVVLRLPAGGFEFVAAIEHGAGLGAAAARASAAAAGFDLQACLALLMGRGALTSIDLPRRDPT